VVGHDRVRVWVCSYPFIASLLAPVVVTAVRLWALSSTFVFVFGAGRSACLCWLGHACLPVLVVCTPVFVFIAALFVPAVVVWLSWEIKEGRWDAILLSRFNRVPSANAYSLLLSVLGSSVAF
jgi:hypothetical protein